MDVHFPDLRKLMKELGLDLQQSFDASVFIQRAVKLVTSNLLIGIMLGLAFYVTNKGFGYFVLVYGITPIVGALSPLLIFLVAAWAMMRRVA